MSSKQQAARERNGCPLPRVSCTARVHTCVARSGRQLPHPTPQVSKLFSKIIELLEDTDALVFVLIDEIESLASARKVSAQAQEEEMQYVAAVAQ